MSYVGLCDDELYLGGQLVASSEDLVHVYRQRVAVHGLTAEMMFYRSQEQHMTKVAQFSRLLFDLVGPRDRVVDVGCGYGVLVTALPPCSYSGIDIVPEFIEYAAMRYKNVPFRCLSIDQCEETFDWSVLLGVVNSVPRPELIVYETWQRSTQGLLVDFLDKKKVRYSGDEDTRLNLFDIGRCVEYLRELGAATITVYDSSAPWSIVVARKQGAWLQWR